MSAAWIVLIEDNPADVFLVELALKEKGIPFKLTRFASGLEALRVLCPTEESGADAPVPDAILLDLNTPKSDGFQVLDRLTHSPRLAQAPIAIITSSAATSDKHRAALMGIRYIQKPSGLVAFLTTVGNALQEMLSTYRASF